MCMVLIIYHYKQYNNNVLSLCAFLSETRCFSCLYFHPYFPKNCIQSLEFWRLIVFTHVQLFYCRRPRPGLCGGQNLKKIVRNWEHRHVQRNSGICSVFERKTLESGQMSIHLPLPHFLRIRGYSAYVRFL